MKIIGRKKEIREFNELYNSGKDDTETISWRSPGNWKIKEMPAW